jgi:hypothetical protein
LSKRFSRMLKNPSTSFRDAAKRRARNPETSGSHTFLDSGLAPSVRPGMTALTFSAAR